MIRTFLVLFLFTAPMMAQTSTTAAGSEKFARIAEQFMKESLVLSPVSASYAGYHKHRDASGKEIELDALLDDGSLEAALKQRDFYRAWQARFNKETPLKSLNLQDAADWQLLQDQIALALMELEQVKQFRHNPTQQVELIGNALFLPMTQEYASKETRMRHVLSRMQQIPRFLEQAKKTMLDADPIYVKVAIEENAGNVDLIENTVKKELPPSLTAEYDKVAPVAVAALKTFSAWLENDFGKRKPSRTWRLGKPWYDEKFRLVMQTRITPAEILASAERELKEVRAEMLELATPMHKQMYADHPDHSDLNARDRENKIIGEVLHRISDEHANRDELIQAVERDLESIKQFIRDKKIVALSGRDNLKVVPTPPFMRGIYSVAGFHSAPPLEPNAEAQYWVTPIDPKMPTDRAESKLREYNKWTLQWLTIHEALPGHYIQFEHANNVQPEWRRLLRALYGNGPYVEGWAEYIAQVMMDSGFAGGDPRFRMMMRKIRLRLLANTILDVKMHTQNMTDEQAMELMTKDAFQTQAEAEGKLTRAKLSSAQLPTYYVGYRDWVALRKKYEAKKGAAFNMQEFHDRVLDLGPLPIAYLEKIVLQ